MSTPLLLSEVFQWLIMGGLALLVIGQAYILSGVLRRPSPNGVIDNGRLGIGIVPPELHAADARGQRVVDISEYAQQKSPVVLAFLAPGCASCARAIQGLNALAKAQVDTAFVAVLPATSGDEYAAALGPSFSIVRDTRGTWQREFEVRSFPHLEVIGADGLISAHGVRTSDEVDHSLSISRVDPEMNGAMVHSTENREDQ